MDTQQFDRSLGDLAASLGDPTRRGIYVSVRESAEPVTANQVAELFSIHPNVARHHLDRLAADGYLQGTRGRRSGTAGPGAGRPAKYYEATAKEIAIQYPPRRHEMLAELLVRVVERLAPEDGPQVAEEIGREYGRALADQIGLPEEKGFDSAVGAVARAMTGVGFEMQAEPADRRLLTSHCPFGKTAADHPELVCKLDQGIVRGLMEAVHPGEVPIVVTPHDHPAQSCVTQLGADCC